MPYGIQILDASGTVTFDNTRFGGVYIGKASLLKSTSGTITYPNFVGKSIFTYKQFAGNLATSAVYNCYTITYPSGIPTITYNNTSTLTDLYLQVFAK